MARRKHFSQKDRDRILTAHKGICHLCNGRINVGEAWEVEHRIEWCLTNDDSDENVAPAHKKCHREKTSARAGDLAKVERQRLKNNGAFPKSRSRIQSRGFASTRTAGPALWQRGRPEDPE